MLIGDLDHFALKADEALILRLRRQFSGQELRHLSDAVGVAFPGRVVLLLPQDVDIMAGRILTPTPPPADAEADTIEVHQAAVEKAYSDGKMIYVREPTAEWWIAHKFTNPHTIDFGQYDYSLTKPKDCP